MFVVAAATCGGIVASSVAAAPGAAAAARVQVQADPAADEASFVEAINAYRAQNGAGPLVSDPELVRVARAWSTQMRAAGEISHNPNLRTDVKASWRKLGENVGVGPTVADLHQAFINSPAHRRNLVDPSFQRVGIGIVYDSDGTIFVTEQFMEMQPAATTPTVAGVSVTAPPTAAPTDAPAQLALAAPAAKKPVVRRVTRRR